jgi:hypothetical protein
MGCPIPAQTCFPRGVFALRSRALVRGAPLAEQSAARMEKMRRNVAALWIDFCYVGDGNAARQPNVLQREPKCPLRREEVDRNRAHKFALKRKLLTCRRRRNLGRYSIALRQEENETGARACDRKPFHDARRSRVKACAKAVRQA